MRVYGMNVLKELDKKKIKKVFTSRKEVCKYCGENKIKYELVDNHLLNKMCEYNHQGVVIEAFDYDYYNLKDLEGNLVLILDHLEDPHNFGAIIRTCAAVGVKSIIIPKDRSVEVNSTVMKVSAGALNNIKIVEVNNLVSAMEKLKDNGFWIYATDMDGEEYTKVEYAEKTVLVIGAEGTGVSKRVGDNSDFIISIPMFGKINSLNASVAAGIAIYEVVRQRKQG